jgi:hypothetical protein
VGQPGITHDQHVFKTSVLGKNIKLLVPKPYYLLADKGYSLRPTVITPYGRKQATAAEGRFNKKHSSGRNPVETTFGGYKGRFRVWKYKGGFALDSVDAYITANKFCVILHNLALDFGLRRGLFAPSTEGTDDDEELEGRDGDEDEEADNDGFSDADEDFPGYERVPDNAAEVDDEEEAQPQDEEDADDLVHGRAKRDQLRIAMGAHFKNPGE